MEKEQAIQIANLINERNHLVKKHTAECIMKEQDSYVFMSESEKIIACAESKKVQWYQWEIRHVSVDPSKEGNGYGNKILKLAEEKALKDGARILQCTIRTNNDSSIRLFTRKGYKQVNCFYNLTSKNWLFVFQKCVSLE